jgi:GGDEF domain-containing protein
LIKKHSKGDDIIVRWGGDEYVVILPNSTEKQATQFIKDVTTQMKKESI